jgi:hypothetical protein
MKLSKSKIIGLVILFFGSFPMWLIAISSASNSHFFEDQFAVQLMILGGAVATIAGVFFLVGSW